MKKCDDCRKETNDLYFHKDLWICDECRNKLEKHYTRIAKEIGHSIPPERHRKMHKGSLDDEK